MMKSFSRLFKVTVALSVVALGFGLAHEIAPVVSALGLLPQLSPSSDDDTIWQIGAFDGLKHEFGFDFLDDEFVCDSTPAGGPGVTGPFVVGVTPIDSMPNTIASSNASTSDSRYLHSCNSLTIEFESPDAHGYTDVVLLYARMGGEADEVFFDGESVGIAGNMPEDPLASRDYLFDLDDFGPGKHTIQIVGQEVTPCDTGQTCRDGFSDGYHFIDALRLSGTAKEDIPGITGSIDPEPNANGWNNTNVTISFETDIDPSEIDSITPDIDVMTEGEGQVFTGTVVDTSGGSNSVDVIVNLDKTAPDVAIVLPGEGVPVVVPEVTVTGDVSDGLSGVDSVTCNGVVAEVEDSTFICGVPVDEGDNTITVMATDLAGNMSQDSITVRGILDVNDEPELRCHGFIPTLIGTNGDDSIMGTDGSDVIVGLDGNDILIGLDGRDYICGGPGNDTIVGGRGNDRLHGEAGNDTIAGQEGDDELVGDGGEDILSGGPGMDDIMCGTEFDAVDGGSDTDQIAADCEYVVNNASSGNSAEPETPCTDVTPTIVGTNGDDVLVGTNGDDVISGRGGNDILIGLDGRDRLCGGEGDDVLIGGLERDHLNGGPGNDLLNGGQGQDHLLGERGFDMLYGGNDDDHIKCGNGEDFANGSLGVDTTDGTCETTIGIP